MRGAVGVGPVDVSEHFHTVDLHARNSNAFTKMSVTIDATS
jgi:hypothetical protein